MGFQKQIYWFELLSTLFCTAWVAGEAKELVTLGFWSLGSEDINPKS